MMASPQFSQGADHVQTNHCSGRVGDRTWRPFGRLGASCRPGCATRCRCRGHHRCQHAGLRRCRRARRGHSRRTWRRPARRRRRCRPRRVLGGASRFRTSGMSHASARSLRCNKQRRLLAVFAESRCGQGGPEGLLGSAFWGRASCLASCPPTRRKARCVLHMLARLSARAPVGACEGRMPSPPRPRLRAESTKQQRVARFPCQMKTGCPSSECPSWRLAHRKRV